MSYHFTLTLSEALGLLLLNGIASAYGFFSFLVWRIKRREKKISRIQVLKGE